jgi:DmsE family decaheme c-type cytochrome
MLNLRWPMPGLIRLGIVGAFVASSSVAGAKSKDVDWPALNPAFEGATFVKDSTVCASCHEEYMKVFSGTRHAQAFRGGHLPETGECESCHGPRSKHVDNPTRDLDFRKLSRKQQSGVCLQCHEGGTRMGWKGGAHASADVSCSSCHYVMERKSDQALMIRERAAETCYSCHADVRARMEKLSHHPVREGRMDCMGCHDVHGARGPSALKAATVNETCSTCHAEKRGPFVWEHAPVRESCLNCHDAHGSSQRSMLVSKDPFLCLQCHSYGGHINLPRYNRVSNPYGTGCSNCHVSAHGSNHPSGAKLTR